MKSIKNFLNKSYYKEILNLLEGNDFPWYMFQNISNNQNKKDIFDIGFSFNFFVDGKLRDNNYSYFMAPFVYQVMDAVGGSRILRSRADLTVAAPKFHIHEHHVDFKEPNISTIFYVNDTDGDTILYNDNMSIKHREKPEANKLFIFEGHKPHTGCSPQTHSSRILINSNFI